MNDYLNVIAVTEHTATVEWVKPYAFGDSFQHSQGKQLAARALKVNYNRLHVLDAVVEKGRVLSTTWSV